jgi:rhodanese-related sulfurtransferase
MPETTKRAFKDRIYEQFARIGKALASPRRLEILDLLAQREWSVEELAEATDASVASTSHHLQKLKAARLVTGRREGSYVHYGLARPEVAELWRAVREVGELRLAEIDRVVEEFLDRPEELEPVGLDELRDRFETADVLLLDVRPADEYRAGHVDGARSVPVTDLEDYLERLPRDREVVAYCRGPYCVFSDEVVAELRERGFRARRLDAGFPDLRSAGFPVVADADGSHAPADGSHAPRN